jgi:hypothetical protein
MSPEKPLLAVQHLPMLLLLPQPASCLQLVNPLVDTTTLPAAPYVPRPFSCTGGLRVGTAITCPCLPLAGQPLPCTDRKPAPSLSTSTTFPALHPQEWASIPLCIHNKNTQPMPCTHRNETLSRNLATLGCLAASTASSGIMVRGVYWTALGRNCRGNRGDKGDAVFHVHLNASVRSPY